MLLWGGAERLSGVWPSSSGSRGPCGRAAWGSLRKPGCQADEVGDKRVARGQLRGPSVGQEVQGGEALSEAEGTCRILWKKGELRIRKIGCGMGPLCLECCDEVDEGIDIGELRRLSVWTRFSEQVVKGQCPCVRHRKDV
eukprot:1160209-Pelagomonas_calceolata.AAC.8